MTTHIDIVLILISILISVIDLIRLLDQSDSFHLDALGVDELYILRRVSDREPAALV